MIDEFLLSFEQNHKVHPGQCSVLPVAFLMLRYSDVLCPFLW